MKQLMTTEETSQYIRHAVQTLAKWRVYGKGPQWIKMGRSVFYERRDVDAWIDAQTRTSTSSPQR
jgi:predicted DNA-binding transcriptional regulator AlpA